jgi:hypothetical protein
MSRNLSLLDRSCTLRDVTRVAFAIDTVGAVVRDSIEQRYQPHHPIWLQAKHYSLWRDLRGLAAFLSSTIVPAVAGTAILAAVSLNAPLAVSCVLGVCGLGALAAGAAFLIAEKLPARQLRTAINDMNRSACGLSPAARGAVAAFGQAAGRHFARGKLHLYQEQVTWPETDKAAVQRRAARLLNQQPDATERAALASAFTRRALDAASDLKEVAAEADATKRTILMDYCGLLPSPIPSNR